jgi:Zn-dependent protease
MEEKLVQERESKKFNDRVRLGTIAGLPLFFNFSFLFWFLFIIFVDPINLVLFVSLLFFSITIHELAHALASRYLDIGDGTLTIWFLGGFFIPFSEESLIDMSTGQRVKYAFMVLAGPLSNLVLSGLFLLLAYVTSMDLLHVAAQYNLSLAILNLLPFGYLDGGNIVRYLGSIMMDWRKITFFSGILSIVSAVIIFASIFFDSWLGDYANWGGFLIGMGIASIAMTRKTNEQLMAESKEAIERERAITQTTDQSKESRSLISVIVKIGLAGLVIFSMGYLFNQCWTYKDLTGRIAFIDGKKADHRLHLYITRKLGFPTIDADGVPARRIAKLSYLTDPQIIAFPCDSPDQTESTNICIDDHLGRRIAEIPTSSKTIETLMLSPNAKKLAFSAYSEEGVYLVDMPSGAIEKISSKGDVMAWSPDGNHILMAVEVNGSHEVFRTDLFDNETKNLTNNTAEDLLAVYAHDGQYIYFLSDRNGKYELFRMGPDGSNVNKISLENEIYPTNLGIQISPNNTRLLFSCGGWNGDSICSVNVDGTEESMLAKGDIAAWSPDEKYVAISGSDQDAIFIVTSDGKRSVKLKSLERIVWGMAWLP